jgi:hypothetical protein
MGDRVEEEETVPAPPQLPTTSVGVPAVAGLPTNALHVLSDNEESSNEDGDRSDDKVEVLPKCLDGPFAKNSGRRSFDMSPMAEMDLTPMADATTADLSRFRFKYWMDRFFAQHAAGMTAAGMNLLLRMLLFAKEGESFEEMSKELLQRARRRRYQALQGELDAFIAKQLKRLDNNWNRRELSLIGRYGQWQDMQEEIICWERTMEFTDGRANDWEEDMTNGWFEFAGAAASVAAALHGEDSEDADDDNDVAEWRRKRKANKKNKEADSESDDDSEDDRKPPARKTPHGA